MKKISKVMEILDSVESLTEATEVKAVCIDSLLKKELNIFLDKETYTAVIKFCKGDVKKAQKVIRYANTIGKEGVLQVLKG